MLSFSSALFLVALANMNCVTALFNFSSALQFENERRHSVEPSTTKTSIRWLITFVLIFWSNIIVAKGLLEHISIILAFKEFPFINKINYCNKAKQFF